MTLSSMVVSRDWQEIGVLECILGGLHIGVDVEPDPERARRKLSKSKVDALIVDCDLRGSTTFLRDLRQHDTYNSVPLVIVSGSSERRGLAEAGANFVFEKPISVEQAVHTLSAARSMILDGRLRYHRHILDVPVLLTCGDNTRVEAKLMNLSQGGVGVHTAKNVPTDEAIRVSFSLPGSKISVKMLGKLAWADRHGHAGIRFVRMSGRLKRDLQLWLEQHYFVS
jgi:DNA-binding response OmpR family regulator